MLDPLCWTRWTLDRASRLLPQFGNEVSRTTQLPAAIPVAVKNAVENGWTMGSMGHVPLLSSHMDKQSRATGIRSHIGEYVSRGSPPKKETH